MRGYAEHGKLQSGAFVITDTGDRGHKANLSIAGHGTFQGEWRTNKLDADLDLNELIRKHLPGGMPSAGIPAAASLAYPATRGEVAPDPSLHEPNEVRRQLGHHFNDPGY